MEDMAMVFRAGELDAPWRSLEHPVMRAAEAVRPQSHPGLAETVFACRTFAEAVMWARWVRVTHCPSDAIKIYALAVSSERLYAYPADLWDEISAAPNIELAASRYWKSGLPWEQLQRAVLPEIWHGVAGVELLVPVNEIRAVEIAFTFEDMETRQVARLLSDGASAVDDSGLARQGLAGVGVETVSDLVRGRA
jgi:hypothetical protein